MNEEIQRLSYKIISNLSPDLLKKNYKDLSRNKCKVAGHCYVATECLYHFLGGKESNYIPQRAKDKRGITHWWLKNKTTNEIIDLTSSQYYDFGELPPYETGRNSGFLTKEPSKRTRILMKRIIKDS